jgi:RecB family exonuclease
VGVTGVLAPALETRGRARIAAASPALGGTLVHRLFERFGSTLAREGGEPAITTGLARVLRDEEALDAGDVEQIFDQARLAYLALCGQPTLVEALGAGDALFEVPFSVRSASSPMILRGTFDCLIVRQDGGVTVLELKTGRPAPEHSRQLETYLTAARAIFPGRHVDGTLVYARHLDDRPLDPAQ